ncbi:hypothetical protein M0P48_04990 [Candidatus Gracilibacteria bacterium]|nr:hypothetical protein [Candidatus Gracilibacteria bacterium]
MGNRSLEHAPSSRKAPDVKKASENPRNKTSDEVAAKGLIYGPENPKDTIAKREGKALAKKVIDKRPKNPNDIPDYYLDYSENPFRDGIYVDDYDEEDISKEEKKINALMKDIGVLIKDYKDIPTLKGMITKKGQKRFSLSEVRGEGTYLTIKYGNEDVSIYNSFSVDAKDCSKAIRLLNVTKNILKNPVKDAPKYMVVKTTPDTIKNLGASLVTSYRGGENYSVVPSNTLVKVLRTDAETGYSYLSEGGFVHSSLLEPYDPKNLHPENFGTKKVKLRPLAEITKNGGLNLRSENGDIIGKVPPEMEVDVLAIDDKSPNSRVRVLVQYRDPADQALKTGYLVYLSDAGTRYLSGVK